MSAYCFWGTWYCSVQTIPEGTCFFKCRCTSNVDRWAFESTRAPCRRTAVPCLPPGAQKQLTHVLTSSPVAAVSIQQAVTPSGILLLSIFLSISTAVLMYLCCTLLLYTCFFYRVAPVVQVVNLEFYLCLSPGFEPQVGRTNDFICKHKKKGFNC